MADKRLNKDQFFGKLAELDEAGLKTALWTLYWRGSAPVRERIESAIDPRVEAVRKVAAAAPPDADDVLQEVLDFVGLAGSGAYLGGDRRVSPKERSGWRFTFRRLADQSRAALAGPDVTSAGEALEALVDLAQQTKSYDLFRSDDPVEAARFVVSDAVGALWTRFVQEYGFAGFARRAAGQLYRWEERHGWTRYGYGWVAERERPLAEVVTQLLPTTDAWGQFADAYLVALDEAARTAPSRRSHYGQRAEDRTDALAMWHGRLLDRLAGSDHEDRLDRIVRHPTLTGPEQTFLQARLAEYRGDRDAGAVLIRKCLAVLPGHPEFRAFAEDIDAGAS
ncbi:hypothetical protein [Intrasporangium sp.]|uniref:hypothetical protein n=1 Tax=Intrasporangium sp. TaxID=1925024 RepID=UPI0032215922